jgi:hypothetical protein
MTHEQRVQCELSVKRHIANAMNVLTEALVVAVVPEGASGMLYFNIRTASKELLNALACLQHIGMEDLKEKKS